MIARWIFALVSCAAFAAARADEDGMRVWTSSDGSVTIEGRLFRESRDEVMLVLPNGRSHTIKKESLSEADLEWLKERAGKPKGAAGAGGAPATATIPAALKGKLLDASGKRVALGEAVPAPKYYLFYYSASWCGPCVRFTPELVQFYRKVKGAGADVEFILVPSDRSRADALAYM